MRGDAISIVEAAYDLQPSDPDWLARLLEQAEPRLNCGFGVTISTYARGMPPDESLVQARGMDDGVRDAMLEMARADPEIFQLFNLNSTGRRCATVTEILSATLPRDRIVASFARYMHPVGVYDFLGVMSFDPSGHRIWLGASMPKHKRPSPTERATWSLITAHVSAGARLRRQVARLASRDLATGSEAVLSPSGSVEHAEPSAQSRSAREQLREAARRIDRARSKARSDDEEALGLWTGLTAGRWSLVEQFDRDGRRYLVVHKNDPQVKDPRALTMRERQVLAYVAAGDSLKLTAYTLGLSVTSVHRHRASAMRKLGLRTQADVAKLLACTPGSDDGPGGAG